MTSTYFTLLAVYQASEIPVAALAANLYGITREEANKRAARQDYPFPVYRTPGGNGKTSQKSPWLADAQEVAKAIDQAKNTATQEWNQRHAH